MDTNSFSGETILRFFDGHVADDGDANDVTKQIETDMVRWLVGSPALPMLLDVLHVKANPFIACEVRHPVIENPNRKPGDIDLLICENYQPERAIALQFKKVKVVALGAHGDQCTHLKSLRDGVRQANHQRENLGFYKNYLAVLILTLGSSRSAPGILFRDASRETFKKVYDFPQEESVHPDVGLLFIEISQPTGRSINHTVMIDIGVDREPIQLDQVSTLSSRIREFIRSKGHVGMCRD